VQTKVNTVAFIRQNLETLVDAEWIDQESFDKAEEWDLTCDGMATLPVGVIPWKLFNQLLAGRGALIWDGKVSIVEKK